MLCTIICFAAKVCGKPESWNHKGMEIETNFTDDHLHFVGDVIVYICSNPLEAFKSGSRQKRVACVDMGETDFRWEYTFYTDQEDFECAG